MLAHLISVIGRRRNARPVAALALLASLSLIAAPPLLAAARDGGEDLDSAVPVTLPFEDTGETCDNLDDLDEACPYPGSTSPDVVYTFTASTANVYRVDLCGSTYDTKVYLYDAGGALVACNDDHYTGPPCGAYVSAIEAVVLEAGQTYFLVVDGYGGDCGAYTLSVCEYPPCLSLECAPDDQPEGEPAPVDGYVDVFNGGCDADPPVFQALSPPAGSDLVAFCGTTGWYGSGDAQQRDSDWLQVRASGHEVVITAEGPTFIGMACDVMEIDPDCNLISLRPFQMGICSPASLTLDTTPGETITLRVRPLAAMRPVCAPLADIYRLQISGLESVVPVVRTTWTAVRAWYR